MGVKYRLKKEYPNSDLIGPVDTIVETNVYNYLTFIKDKFIGIYPKDYPEYWEEVIEKDYEILSFLGDGKNIALKNSSGTFTYVSNSHTMTEEEFIDLTKRKDVVIYSVKRLSDGEVFTIGDKVKSSIGGNTGNIKEFVITDHKYPEVLFGHQFGQRLNNLEKVKTPLFKTEDGVDIFEGDNYYAVHKKTLQLGNAEAHMTVNKWNFSNGDWLLFSTKIVAEDYIFKNKPILSYNEVSEIYKKYYISITTPSSFHDLLIDKVKEKLK